MKKLNLVFTLALTVVALTTLGGIGCAHNKTVFEADKATASTEKSGSGLEGKVEWAKRRKTRLDASVILTNHYPFPIVIDTNSWSLTANGKTGSFISQGFAGTLDSGAVAQGIVKFDVFSETMPPVDVVLTLTHLSPDKNSDAGEKVKKTIAPLVISYTISK